MTGCLRNGYESEEVLRKAGPTGLGRNPLEISHKKFISRKP